MTWRIIGDDRFRALAWAKERFPATYPEHEKFTALISEFDGDIRGVVFYTDFQPTNSIDLHIAAVAGRKWLTWPFLRAAFGYPFEQLALRRVTGRIAASNHRANSFVERLGFQREGLVRQGWHTGDDLVIWGMLRSECRFLGTRNDLFYGSNRAIREQHHRGPEQRLLPLDRLMQSNGVWTSSYAAEQSEAGASNFLGYPSR